MYKCKNLYFSPSLARHLFFFFFRYKIDKYFHRKYFFGDELFCKPGITEFCLLWDLGTQSPALRGFVLVTQHRRVLMSPCIVSSDLEYNEGFHCVLLIWGWLIRIKTFFLCVCVYLVVHQLSFDVNFWFLLATWSFFWWLQFIDGRGLMPFLFWKIFSSLPGRLIFVLLEGLMRI